MKRINHLTTTALSMVLTVLLLTATACHKNQPSNNRSTADSLLFKQALDSIYDIAKTLDLKKTFQLIDSFQNAGRITPAEADHQRGIAHYMRDELAEGAVYWKKVIEACSNGSEHNPSLLVKGLLNLSSFYSTDSQYEEALHVLMPVINDILNNPDVTPFQLGQMFATIAECQLELKHYDEAKNSFEKAFDYYQQALDAKPSATRVAQITASTANAFIFYNAETHLKEKLFWTNRVDSLLNVLKSMPDVNMEHYDWLYGEVCLSRAMILTAEKKPDEAAKAYEQFRQTSYGQDADGLYNAVPYLEANGRYGEIADIFQNYDSYSENIGREMNLEHIVNGLFMKFHFNYYAGRKDTAMAVMLRIDSLIQPAFKRQKESDAAKLATIFETQQKEAQISRQQAELSQQRLWGAVIVFALITLFFIIYTIHRRRAARRIAEMRAAQERIESELRIARDIQMSMVPSVFPEREGLDMYASMTPAKEVGGDLYGYVLLGDKLYFALGDVSGKGVPASLFMAQATRLFRTLAVQQMMPAEICSRMNDALSGDDNESGMFVTFFLGLIDLQTGHLDFCNAGHNPPVIGGGENHGDFLDVQANAPIGLWPGLEYEGEEIENIKGKPLFIYTDGLNEAEDLQQKQFGDDRLLDILRHTHFDSAQQVIDTLAAEVEHHRNGAEPNDDLTMMCIRVE